jgi:hypothetical protein
MAILIAQRLNIAGFFIFSDNRRPLLGSHALTPDCCIHSLLCSPAGEGPRARPYSSLNQTPEEWVPAPPGKPCSGESMLLLLER